MQDNIQNVDVIEFSFPEEDFVIYHEEGIWRAKAGNEDEEIVIEDKGKNILMTEEILLFGGFILTLEKFNSLKKFTD